MAATGKWYGKALEGQFGATSARRVEVALCTSSYTPDQDAHDFFSDITNEVSGTGYTAGGASLANKAVSYSAGSNRLILDADNTAWTTASFTARYAIIYKDTGSGATSPLLGYVDLGGDQTVTAATFTIEWDANGVLTATAS
jgi:hypothetical protein